MCLLNKKSIKGKVCFAKADVKDKEPTMTQVCLSCSTMALQCEV